MAPRRNLILEQGRLREETSEDESFQWYPSRTAAKAAAAQDELDNASTALSDASSELSTVPTFSSEWSTKARLDGKVPPRPKEFNYETVNWSALSGYTMPLGPHRNLTSPIWRFGVPIEFSKTGKRWWLCTECHVGGASCKHIYSAEGGTHSAIQHIKLMHNKTWNRTKAIIDAPLITRSTSLPIDLDADEPREQAMLNAIAQSFDHHQFRRLLTRWIVYDNVSFRQVDSEPFREFIQYIAPRAGGELASANTIRGWIMSAYGLHKAVVKNLLTKALSKIHIAFDLWTSGNHKALNGIVAHFINDDWKPYAVVLGAPEQKEAHSGDNIAGQVISTLKDFGITADRLGYFMLDNASNNDTAMEAIAAEYGFDVEKRRLRCAGHIINLIARSLLYGFDKTLFEEFEEELNLPQSVEEELEIWRRCGPIGKAHNLIVWIYASPQRVARWHEG